MGIKLIPYLMLARFGLETFPPPKLRMDGVKRGEAERRGEM